MHYLRNKVAVVYQRGVSKTITLFANQSLCSEVLCGYCLKKRFENVCVANFVFKRSVSVTL